MMSYYNRPTAEATAKLLAKLLENPETPLVIQHQVLGVKQHSLLTRLYNSLAYLCDEMDPDGTWKELKSCLRLSLVHNGVKMELIRRELDKAVVPFVKGNSSDLIGRITQFLEDPRLLRFEEVNISIPDELKDAIIEMVKDLDIISIVRNDRVKLIKEVAQN